MNENMNGSPANNEGDATDQMLAPSRTSVPMVRPWLRFVGGTGLGLGLAGLFLWYSPVTVQALQLLGLAAVALGFGGLSLWWGPVFIDRVMRSLDVLGL